MTINTNPVRSVNKVLASCCIALVDLCAYYVALWISFTLRSSLDLYLPMGMRTTFTLDHFLAMQTPPLIIVLFMAYRGLYTKRMAFWDETLEILKIIFFSCLIISVIVTMGKLNKDISRLLIVIMSIVSIVVFPLFRLYGKKLLNSLKVWNERIIVIGAGVAGQDFARGLLREKHMGYTVMGFLDDDPAKHGVKVNVGGMHELKVLGAISKCKEFVKSYNLSALAIAIPSLETKKQAEMINQLQQLTPRLLFVPEIRGVALANTNLYHLFDEELFVLRINNNLKSAVNKFYKFLFDYILTLLALPVFLPILLIVSVLIRLDSEGPALFVQDRLGKNGKLFKCYKFRTMYIDNDCILDECLKDTETREQWEVYKKIKGKDPRVTRIGAFLRKTSLDELPQLLNILKGDMCLVGPRPYLPREIEQMQGVEDVILETKPGITGLWQVSGRNRLSFSRRLRLDMWYVRNWSLWIDVVMLIKTVKVVIKSDGAY